ncbi:pumilio homolog 3-like [Dreissena polymorpha]|uniref:pumilio homolog 3-like n=1 Tax=Dreissena polymorpha TaxID=45954 RepID=UPI002264F966|nr:pumilio homolog 3-like [Dreissena polymorpha]
MLEGCHKSVCNIERLENKDNTSTMETSRRHKHHFGNPNMRGNPEGDSIVMKKTMKNNIPQDFDASADYGASPSKRRKQHSYNDFHPSGYRKEFRAPVPSFAESELSALDITDTPESLSQISAIAPVSDISNTQPSFMKKSRVLADTTWENAVSHARGEPDGAEKSFKRSKVSIRERLETVPEDVSDNSKGSSSSGKRRPDTSTNTNKPLTVVERNKSVKSHFRRAASVLRKAKSKSKLPENKVGTMKRMDATLADETMTKKPDTKELSKKERKQVRKAMKSNFEQIQRSKKIWEELRRVNTTPEKKTELCSELYTMVKGSMKEFCFAHDTARVIQCLIQYGTTEHREMVFEELKDEITTMAKSKYAKFLVKKMLMYGTKHHRSCVYKSFHGHVRKLIRHRIAADVLEYAYNEYANAHQRLSLLEDFYGPSFCLFKTPDIKCLGQIMLSQPDKREMILRNMREALLPLIDKNILVHSMVHKVFMEYFTYADNKMKSEMIESLRESVIHILHTRDGARVAMQCVWHGTAKDRKCLIKSLKGNVVKICQEEFGHLVMLAIFDCVDDTKLVKVALLDEMLKSVSEVADNQYGRKVLLYVLNPRDPHHFHPDMVRVLQEGDQSLTSKKEKSVRYQELLMAVSECLLQYIVDHVTRLVVNNNMLLLVLAVITHAHGDPTHAMEAVAHIAAEPFVAGNTEGGLHIIENPAGHMTLKRLIQNDKQRMNAGQKVLFSEVLLGKLPEGAVKAWAACNRGCFTIVSMLDLEHPEIIKNLVSCLKGLKSSLKKMTFKGAQVLAQKIDEANKTAV